ncbi:hypothetical protein [Candidatus Manganitrophus noduliformans]|uniref:Uncharacterized protein n=1 Tax=Candidatus Manganitrophus noduliformans TaxID=2606439 RepID=A0A7X6DU81_9BACT|nr:hypothetical protein [Candidatus Manganitrophus noduliformans]NKE73502.1 hypothetical protein [Candidatus Manganitrophus noduliformans]
MKLEILNRIHPLVEEAWTKGFRIFIDEDKIVVRDLVGPGAEGSAVRQREADDLGRRIDQNKEEVWAYLQSLESVQVKIESKVLGESVWIVGSETVLKRLPQNQVAYLPEEIYKIKQANWSAETIRKIHQVKKFFGGSILK